jgi:hypothetical protein
MSQDLAKENAGTEVSECLFSLHYNLLIYCCALCHRAPDVGEPYKAAKQKPSGVLVPPSMTIASALTPSATIAKGGAGLTTCNYANARSSTQLTLQCLESLKNMEADREGNGSCSFDASCCLYFC